MTYHNEPNLENQKINFTVPQSLEIQSYDQYLDHHEVLRRINGWAQWLSQIPSRAQGLVVNFEHWTPDILCFYLALLVTETPYYAVSEANFTQHTLKQVRDRGMTLFVYQALPYRTYDSDRLNTVNELGYVPIDFAQQVMSQPQTITDTWSLQAQADNFYCFTSGTTGPAQLISHKNRSLLWASAQAARLFYTSTDTVSMSVLPNHIGVMSMGVMGPILAGSKINLCFYSDPDFAQRFAQGNKCLMFYYGYLKHCKDVDLANFDLVITGGEPIRQTFLDAMFAKGVGRVASVYGLTECLPPVATKYFDHAEISYDLGEFTEGIEYRIRNGQLELRGPDCYLPAGQWKTSGDLVEVLGNQVHFITREVNSVRISDNLVILDRLRECCERLGLEDFVIRAEEAEYLTPHDKECVLVLYSQQNIDLALLNSKVIQELGELYRIHLHKKQRWVVRNDIFKAVMQ